MYDFRVLLLGPCPSPEIGSNLGPPNYGMLVLALVLLMHQQAIWHLRFSKFVMLRRRTTCSRAPYQEGKLSTTRGGQIFGLGLFFFFAFWCDFGSHFWGRKWDQFLGLPYCGLRHRGQIQVPKMDHKSGPRNFKKTVQVQPCDAAEDDRDGRLWALGGGVLDE